MLNKDKLLDHFMIQQKNIFPRKNYTSSLMYEAMIIHLNILALLNINFFFASWNSKNHSHSLSLSLFLSSETFNIIYNRQTKGPKYNCYVKEVVSKLKRGR